MNGKINFLFMVSVICPIYNEEKYIGKCIEPIMRKDYPKEDINFDTLPNFLIYKASNGDGDGTNLIV